MLLNYRDPFTVISGCQDSVTAKGKSLVVLGQVKACSRYAVQKKYSVETIGEVASSTSVGLPTGSFVPLHIRLSRPRRVPLPPARVSFESCLVDSFV